MDASDRALRFRRAADVDEFDRLAGEFIRAREAEHNLMLALCSGLRASASTAPVARPAAAPPTLPPYFAVVTSSDSVVAAAMRTPPHGLILSNMRDDGAVDLIVDDLLEVAPDLTGVLGEKRRALRFAERWTTNTQRAYRLNTAERIFQLTTVIAPKPAGGRMRIAKPDDRDLVTQWFAAFIREALREDGSAAGTVADLWINARDRTLYLWEDAAVVSMCGAAGRTPNGTRIGAVYTPPGMRGRGYASSCVAAASQAQLDSGLRYCFLYTDLANPTSNHIYRDMGYEPVCDVDEYRFEDPA